MDKAKKLVQRLFTERRNSQKQTKNLSNKEKLSPDRPKMILQYELITKKGKYLILKIIRAIILYNLAADLKAQFTKIEPIE